MLGLVYRVKYFVQTMSENLRVEKWMRCKVDDRVNDYCQLPNGFFNVTCKSVDGVDFEGVDDQNRKPSHL